MAIETPAATSTSDSSRFLPAGHVVVALALLAVLSLPLLLARPGPLSSDESRSVTEGLNLALGKGYTYTTGEPVTDRGPLFPALLAADFSVAGFSLDHARWVPRLFALGNAILLLALGWRLFGREAGLMAGATALVSSFLILMGTSLFLDGTEVFFLLLMLLFLHPALMASNARWAALAGVSLGLAMLTKESAILWLPLPFVAMLLLGRAIDRPRALVAAYGAGVLLVAGWWWPYTYAVSGRVYLLGDLSQAAPWLGAGTLIIGLAAIAAIVFSRGGRAGKLGPRQRWLAVGLLLAAWGGLFLIGLERHAGSSLSGNLLTNVPEYTASVLAAWLRPLPLIAPAWAYVAYRAARGSLGDRLLLLALLLFLPFALVVADRDSHVRGILPLAYLSYLALGRAAIDFARRLADMASESLTPATAGALAAVAMVAGFSWFAVTETQRFADVRSAFDETTVDQRHWDNPLVQDAARWIEEHVPAGAPIMSGRLYYSHLYALTDGNYPWWQLPTVAVEFSGSPPAPVRTGALLSWEDATLPAGDGEPWLYLRRRQASGGYIALSEPDLLTEIVDRKIRYLVLTGDDDAGISSLALLPYFEDQPAFRKVAAFVSDETNQVHIFEIRLVDLDSTAPPARIDRETADALTDELGAKTAHDLMVGLSPGGYVITGAPGSATLSAAQP